MKLVDSNVWLALSLGGHEHHQAASDWFAQQRNKDSVVFCRLTQLSFLKLLTTKAILNHYGNPPLTNKQSHDLYQDLLSDHRICFIDEPAGFEAKWTTFASRPTASPKLWMDAYLAAFAIAGLHQLITLDTAFHQFQGLDLHII